MIVPFICDGVKEISENKGIASVYSHSYSLNTGVPRYKYIGKSYYFSKTGLLNESKNEFNILIEPISDSYFTIFVIEFGPEFYLPNESNSRQGYLKMGK